MIKNSAVFWQCFFYLLWNYNCQDAKATTLTTSLKFQSTSPIPSTIFRRVVVNVDGNEVTNSKNIFSLISKKLDDNITVWDWEDWCQLQPSKGHCKENITRYYYNAQFEQCMTFEYSGCGQNENNFQTDDLCWQYCKGAGPLLEDLKIRKVVCSYQPDAGMCLEFLPRYYYDVNSKTCKKFTYGGCGGNYNNFLTSFTCMKLCAH